MGRKRHDAKSAKAEAISVGLYGFGRVMQLQVNSELKELYNFKVFEDSLSVNKRVPGAKNEESLNSKRAIPETLSITLSEFRDKINRVKNDNKHYQSDITGSDPRGSVSFTENGPVMTLFKGRDSSTIMHESAHIWLNDYFELSKKEGLSDSEKSHIKTLKSWLQINDGQEKLTSHCPYPIIRRRNKFSSFKVKKA